MLFKKIYNAMDSEENKLRRAEINKNGLKNFNSEWLYLKSFMHQSIETPAPRPPGHNGEFNIYPVLKDGLFPRPRGQDTC